MNQQSQKDTSPSPHELENREAEKLARELESPLGAQKLGDEAYEMVKQELAKKDTHR